MGHSSLVSLPNCNLVPRVFSLSNMAAYWKARRPWGRSCTQLFSGRNLTRSADPGLKFCSPFCIYLPVHCLVLHLLSFLFFRSKGTTVYFVSSSYMLLDKKTLQKVWLNPGLNFTIFRGTEPCRTKHLLVRPAQPRSQSSSAISDVTSPVQASSGNIWSNLWSTSGHSDSANWPGYEAAACYC